MSGQDARSTASPRPFHELLDEEDLEIMEIDRREDEPGIATTSPEFEFPIVWKRDGMGRDLAILASYERRLAEAVVEATGAYSRVDHLRDLVDALRTKVRNAA